MVGSSRKSVYMQTYDWLLLHRNRDFGIPLVESLGKERANSLVKCLKGDKLMEFRKVFCQGANQRSNYIDREFLFISSIAKNGKDTCEYLALIELRI